MLDHFLLIGLHLLPNRPQWCTDCATPSDRVLTLLMSSQQGVVLLPVNLGEGKHVTLDLTPFTSLILRFRCKRPSVRIKSNQAVNCSQSAGRAPRERPLNDAYSAINIDSAFT